MDGMNTICLCESILTLGPSRRLFQFAFILVIAGLIEYYFALADSPVLLRSSLKSSLRHQCDNVGVCW